MQSPPLRIRSTLVSMTARNILFEAEIKEPPVPAKLILDRYAVVHWFMDDYEEGFCLKHAGENHIYLNRKMVKGRDNYTYGHELGHVVLGHLDYDEKTLTNSHISKIKREADYFASCLLMPDEWLYKICDGRHLCLKSLSYLVNKFDVSWEAMSIRLDQLKICEHEYIKWMWSNKKGRV